MFDNFDKHNKIKHFALFYYIDYLIFLINLNATFFSDRLQDKTSINTLSPILKNPFLPTKHSVFSFKV